MNGSLNVGREVKPRGRAQKPTLRSGCGKRRVLGKMLDREVSEAGWEGGGWRVCGGEQ